MLYRYNRSPVVADKPEVPDYYVYVVGLYRNMDMPYATAVGIYKTVISLILVYPFYYLLIYSFSDPTKAYGNAFFLPAGFNTDAYIAGELNQKASCSRRLLSSGTC